MSRTMGHSCGSHQKYSHPNKKPHEQVNLFIKVESFVQFIYSSLNKGYRLINEITCVRRNIKEAK